MVVLPSETNEAPGSECNAISVALYLRQYHQWGRWTLSLDGMYSRIGKSHDSWSLEPHRRLFRWFRRRRLPLDRAFPIGLRIRFLSSLKWRVAGSSLLFGGFALLLGGAGYATDVLDTADGWIEDSIPTRTRSSFPYCEWVEIKSHFDNGDSSFWVKDQNGTSWKLSGFALATVTDIEVDTKSILSAWKNLKPTGPESMHRQAHDYDESR